MKLLTPWTAAAVASVAIPLLVLLYFLKLRRRELPVSSTLLWKRAVQDLQVNAPFQKLRRNLLLLLQLLVLAAAIFALATPLTRWTEPAGDQVVLLIDQSASMNVVEADGRSRLEMAKAAARDLLRGLPERTAVRVVGFADRARAVGAFTTNRADLLRQIDAISPTEAASRLEEALLLCVADTAPTSQEPIVGAAAAPQAQIELFSDGRLADADEQVIQRGHLRYHPIGAESDNVGFVALDVRRAYERPTRLAILARVENFGPQAVRADVSMRLGDKREVTEVELAAAPAAATTTGPTEADGRSARSVVFEVDHDGAGVVELILHRDDALMADNAVRAPIEPPAPLRVRIVTERPWVRYLLERAFAGMSAVEATFLAPADYEKAGRDDAASEGRAPFDLCVIDNYSTDVLPPGAYLFFGGVPRIDGVAHGAVRDDGTVDEQQLLSEPIATWDDSHPLLRYVNLDEVYVARHRPLTVLPTAVPLVEGEQSTMLAYLATPGHQYVIAAFDLADSNWPMQVPFVVFLYNATRFLTSAGVGTVGGLLKPGDTIVGPPVAAGAKVTVRRPDGATKTLVVGDNQLPLYAHTLETGLYQLRSGDALDRAYAVNLLDRTESHVAPVAELAIGGDVVQRVDAQMNANRPLWPWAIAAALAVLMLEWWVYNRRVLL